MKKELNIKEKFQNRKIIAAMVICFIVLGVIIFLSRPKEPTESINSIIKDYQNSIAKIVKESDITVARLYYSEAELKKDYSSFSGNKNIKCEKILVKADKSVGLYNCKYKNTLAVNLNTDIDTEVLDNDKKQELLKGKKGAYYKVSNFVDVKVLDNNNAKIIYIFKDGKTWDYSLSTPRFDFQPLLTSEDPVSSWVSLYTLGIENKNTASFVTEKVDQTLEPGIYHYVTNKDTKSVIGICVAEDCDKIIKQYNAEQGYEFIPTEE